jgi:hypothetical protein
MQSSIARIGGALVHAAGELAQVAPQLLLRMTTYPAMQLYEPCATLGASADERRVFPYRAMSYCFAYPIALGRPAEPFRRRRFRDLLYAR